MTNHHILRAINNLTNAAERLDEAFTESFEPYSNSLILDGAIQRFEFTFELCWKTLKRCLDAESVETSSPRDVIEKAFAWKWIPSEELWKDMLIARNTSAHVYDIEMAHELYDKIKSYIPAIHELISFLKDRYEIE